MNSNGMIKLIVHPDHEMKTCSYLFAQQKPIIIGSRGTHGVDIPLDEEGLSFPHLVISYQNGHYSVQNIANDPFATLNGEPFGRRLLKNGDRLEVGSTVIACEIEGQGEGEEALTEEASLPVMSVTESKLVEIIAQAISNKSGGGEALTSLDADLEEELELLAEESWTPGSEQWPDDVLQDDSVSELVREMEALWQEEESKSTSMPESSQGSILPFVPSPYHPSRISPAKAEPLTDEPSLTAEPLIAEPPLPAREPEPASEAREPEPAPSPVSQPEKEGGCYVPEAPESEPITAQREEVREEPVAHTEDLEVKSEAKALCHQEADSHDESEPPSVHLLGSLWSGLWHRNWRWWLTGLLIALMLFLLFSGGYLLHLRVKKHIEEQKASQGVADIAMGLMYAHFNQIRPQKQNWADPVFLRKNLGAVLASQYQILACFDAQGQFTNTPYLLRIYTNHDLSQFLVMAQPAPSITQRLIPQPAIVVDSRAMELRKLSDLRAINRLLVNAKTFDGAQAEEISRLIKAGELISLNDVSTHSAQGFTPPRALAVMQPEAANRIYNAPRYFLFGERILNKILSLRADPPSVDDVAILLQELASLEQLPHLVLYSTQGISKALEAQKALAAFAPQHPFWVGYLKIDAAGELINGQLLLRGVPSTQAPNKNVSEDIANVNVENSTSGVASGGNFPMSREEHPFTQQLLQLKRQREEALTPVVEEMRALLQEQLHHYLPNFQTEWQQLSDKMEAIDSQQRINQEEQLHGLLAHYSYEPMSKLFLMISASGLDYLSLNPLQVDFFKQHRRTTRLVRKKLQEIAKSASLDQLSEGVEGIAALLRWEKLPHPQQLIKYQQKLFTTVIHKLSDFLLSPTAHLPQSDLYPHHRSVLTHILSTAWIQDPAVCDYYLCEFEHLMPKD